MIEIELWEMPVRNFGAFVAQVTAPLGIGSIVTADGRTVMGFICEPAAVWPGSGARDITSFGGWRAWLANSADAEAEFEAQPLLLNAHPIL